MFIADFPTISQDTVMFVFLQQALKLMKMNHKPDIAFLDYSLNKKKLVLILQENEVMSLCIR